MTYACGNLWMRYNMPAGHYACTAFTLQHVRDHAPSTLTGVSSPLMWGKGSIAFVHIAHPPSADHPTFSTFSTINTFTVPSSDPEARRPSPKKSRLVTAPECISFACLCNGISFGAVKPQWNRGLSHNSCSGEKSSE